MDPIDPLTLERMRSAARAFVDARLVVLFGSVARSSGGSRTFVDLDHASDPLRFEVARAGILLAEAAPDT